MFLTITTLVKWIHPYGDQFSFVGMNQTYIEDSLLKRHYDASMFVLMFQDGFVYLMLALNRLKHQFKISDDEQPFLIYLAVTQGI